MINIFLIITILVVITLVLLLEINIDETKNYIIIWFNWFHDRKYLKINKNEKA